VTERYSAEAANARYPPTHEYDYTLPDANVVYDPASFDITNNFNLDGQLDDSPACDFHDSVYTSGNVTLDGSDCHEP